MDFKNWLEGKKQEIENLQADTVISVFHGTTVQYAYSFCTNGIDAKHINHWRVYGNHLSGGKRLKFGIFVAPDVNTAFKFGSCVVKFKTTGKNLIYQFPAEMSKSDKHISKRYPNSFRPSVSDQMLTNSVEPQALFIGLVSPRAIEKVYRWEQGTGSISMTREEFIQWADSKDEKLKYKKSLFEPQEYKMSLEDFAKRIAAKENATPEEILEILKRVYRGHGFLTGIGHIPPSLLKRIENQVRNVLRNQS